MTKRGIICSGDEVRGILDGSVMQLRRVMKPQPEGELVSLREWSSGLAEACGDSHPSPDKLEDHSRSLNGKVFPFKFHGRLHSPTCPFGVPGDELWVKETFAIENSFEGNPPPHNDDRPIIKWNHGEYGHGWTQPHYAATDPTPELVCLHSAHEGGPCPKPWRPAQHMPRWASRLDLVLTAVRVQRVQEASEKDLFDEGWAYGASQRDNFQNMWDDKFCETAFAFKKNPWTWVLGIRKKEGDHAE